MIALGPDQVADNRRRAVAIVAVPVTAAAALALVVALALSVVAGLAIAVLAATAALVTYRRSEAAVLSICGATPSAPAAHPRLHNLVDGLCVAAGVPRPRLYVVDAAALNAFSVGRRPQHVALAVTTGLLDHLTRIELEGVLAHELSHVKRHDTSVSTLAACFVAGAALVCDAADRARRRGGPAAAVATAGLVLTPVLPLVARLLRAAVGVDKEPVADLAAASLTRYPPGLAAALEKMARTSTVVASAGRGTAHLWTASPLPGDARPPEESRAARLDRLFTLHPPIEARIEALREL